VVISDFASYNPLVHSTGAYNGVKIFGLRSLNLRGEGTFYENEA